MHLRAQVAAHLSQSWRAATRRATLRAVRQKSIELLHASSTPPHATPRTPTLEQLFAHARAHECTSARVLLLAA